MRLATPALITTERLLLRCLRRSDLAALVQAINDRSVAATTLGIPFPYTMKDATRWLKQEAECRRKGTMLNFVVTLRRDGSIVGGVGLSSISTEHHRAELGYWTASRFRNQGFCTEAARAVLAFAFGVLKLQRVYATHFPRNPASGRVMRKLGMKREGRLRRHALRRGRYEDLETYGILAAEFAARPKPG